MTRPLMSTEPAATLSPEASPQIRLALEPLVKDSVDFLRHFELQKKPTPGLDVFTHFDLTPRSW